MTQTTWKSIKNLLNVITKSERKKEKSAINQIMHDLLQCLNSYHYIKLMYWLIINKKNYWYLT